jgi:predicted transcriptional regulator of viral defense system
MTFEALLRVVQDLPLFHSGLLLAGDVDPADVQRQLVRWTAAGRLIQLRRGLYSVAPPYGRVQPAAFLVANELLSPSYVSCQSALAFHGLIPEAVPVVVSVGTRRTAELSTPLGTCRFRHIARSLFRGYQRTPLPDGQSAFVATPEKALLDLVYLEPHADRADYLDGLRLQNLELLDPTHLRQEAEAFGSPKLRRAAARIAHLAEAGQEGLDTL